MLLKLRKPIHISRIMSIRFASLKHLNLPISIKIPVTTKNMANCLYLHDSYYELNHQIWLLAWLWEYLKLVVVLFRQVFLFVWRVTKDVVSPLIPLTVCTKRVDYWFWTVKHFLLWCGNFLYCRQGCCISVLSSCIVLFFVYMYWISLIRELLIFRDWLALTDSVGGGIL